MSTTPTPNNAGQDRVGRTPSARPVTAKPEAAGAQAGSANVRSAAAKTPTPKLPAKSRAAKPGAAQGAAPAAATAKPGPGKAMPGKAMPGKSMAGKPMAAAKPMAGGAAAVTLEEKHMGKPMADRAMAGDGRKAGRMGKLAPQFPTAVKSLHHYITTPLPVAPASVDYSKSVAEGFPMDGNDQYGDCTMAAAAHLIQAWNAETGIQLPVPTEPDVIAQYLKLSGGQDTGLVESQVLKGWLSSGLWQNKIVAYAPVNVHSLDAIKQAVAFFGGVYVGIQVPGNAQTQFEAHKPWILEQGWQSQQIEGGHAIPILGYDDQYMYCVTWGAVQPMSWDWWSIYGDEAWVVLSEEFDKAGKFNGIDIASLRADIAGQ
jgi:hypothetical protein